MEPSAVIIGSGLGGLECAWILSKNGYKVTVLEKEAVAGGCLRTFCRRDGRGVAHVFDTGFHYVGGLGEGQPLNRLFSYFGLMSLPWQRLDDECFDEVVFVDGNLPAGPHSPSGGRAVSRFPFASGYDRFAGRLAEQFPGSRDELRRYADLLRTTGDNIFKAFSNAGDIDPLFSVPAHGWLRETISDPLLRKVLSGTSLKLALDADRLPLYEFAQINSSFIQSSWRLGGEGGAMIAAALETSIVAAGGSIITGAEAGAIHTDGEGCVTSVEVQMKNGSRETFPADWVISDIHPSLTVSLVDDCRAMRRIYRNRMSSLADSSGMFTVNIALKPRTLPYLNRNIYVHTASADLWHPSRTGTESVMVHFSPLCDGQYAETVDLLSPMTIDRTWRRGAEYQQFKAEKCRECIALAETALPGLSDAVDTAWTSTPLTWKKYTGAPDGTAYGAVKDWNNPLATVISPRTPLKNLLLTGQSLNLHGLLGVSMTSVLTCSLLPGLETLKETIIKL